MYSLLTYLALPKLPSGSGLCPSPYTEIPGDVGDWGSLESHSSIDNILSCARLCDGNPACCSFEYSPTEKKCNLNKECKPTRQVYKDYAFCAKGKSCTSITNLKMAKTIFIYCRGIYPVLAQIMICCKLRVSLLFLAIRRSL